MECSYSNEFVEELRRKHQASSALVKRQSFHIRRLSSTLEAVRAELRTLRAERDA